MDRHLFIVSRLHPQLYKYLTGAFAPERDVEVIVDRRESARRAGADRRATPRGDRRIADRRTAGRVSEELRALGYAFVRQG